MRDTLSLNGRWKFFPAFDEISANQGWMAPGFDPARPNEAPVAGDVGWIEPGFDDSGWLDSSVPSSWNASFEDLWSYEGHCWYRRTIAIPRAWEGRRVEFVSEGANYRTVLYVNGRYAGEHEGGFTPFAIPVTGLLACGAENTIAVSVDNLPKPDRVPGGQYDWWNEGGLYRDVSLRATDRVRIDDVTVVTGIDGERGATVRVAVVVDDDGEPREGWLISATLFDPTGRQVSFPESGKSRPVASLNDAGTAGITIPLSDALLWTPETPHLYRLRISLLDRSGESRDEWEERIGIRTIRVEGTRLLLNGKPLLVKGANTYEDYPGARRSYDEAWTARDFDLLKSIDGNAFRSHLPGHRRRYELADERGVLMLVELPLYQWGRPLVKTDDPRALETAKKQFAELIRALKNRPSVFMWSVSNENLVKPRGDADARAVELAKATADGNIALVDLARALDPTRPVVEVSNCWPGDPVHAVTDLPCVNVYVGSRTPDVSSIPELVQRARDKIASLKAEYPGKPILVGEWGSWCVKGVMTDYFPGEPYQVERVVRVWEALREEPNFVGGFVWCFADYDVHRRFLWVYEYRCAYGLFDYHRQPKLAAGALGEVWKKDR